MDVPACLEWSSSAVSLGWTFGLGVAGHHCIMGKGHFVWLLLGVSACWVAPGAFVSGSYVYSVLGPHCFRSSRLYIFQFCCQLSAVWHNYGFSADGTRQTHQSAVLFPLYSV